MEQLRLESQMSNLEKVKPQRHQDESKAAYHWRIIRSSVREATTLLKQAEIRDILVGHGLHHGRRLNHPQTIQQMVYNKKSKEYLTVDNKFVRVFMEDGRKKDIIAPEEPINRMLYASHVNLYIGWRFNITEIMLLTDEFDVVSTNESPGPILAVAYNENINEVVTVGPGYITSWVFRYGGRHLLPRKTTTEGLTKKDIFTMVVLEETASRTQKAYAACNTGVAVFNLYEGTCLSYETMLHTRMITCMTYFNPLKYLVTGSKDGSIKVWDEQWHLQLVFVGHSGSVLSVASFPYGPHIISSSEDSTIRVWSLETCDQVDQVETKDPVEYLGTNINEDNIFSYSKGHADLWKVQLIHTLHTTIGHKVQKIKCTDHPGFPVRSLLMCRDSSVRIVSPASGDVITTLLQRPKRRLVDAAYAIAEDTMFAVFRDGTIVKCDTSTNPCTIKDQWLCEDETQTCNYLLVYEYVITADMDTDIWSGMQRAIATKSVGTSSNKAPGNKDRTLLLGGRKDGQICVFDWHTGNIEFQIEAHGSKGVLSMVANSKSDQLISAGLDNIIKLWRLYPYAQESLAPLMSFYCGHTPIHMSVMKSKLAVAFQEHSTATYSVVLYNLVDKNRHDHEPGEDHMDSITGLACCPKMKMFASSSHDGTVRIWNNSNKIVRLLKLNAVPTSLAFCSQKGDLLVGIGKHLHKISYKSYMPGAVRYKMISMQFTEPEPEKPLPYDENLLNMLHPEDVKRLKAARSSFKYTHFVDILTDEETQEVMREKKIREKAFALIDKREEELAKMRDGELRSKVKVKPTAATKRSAFDKYLSIFYSRPTTKVPSDDPYEADIVKKMLQDKPPEIEVEPDRSEQDHTGFFPAPSEAIKQPTMVSEDSSVIPEPPLPIKADGFIPNSILVRLLWPQKTLAEQKEKQEEVYRPPQLTQAQMDQLASVKRPSSESPQRRPSTMFMDYDDPEDKRSVTDQSDHSRMSTEGSNLMKKLKSVLDKPPTPKTPEPEEEKKAEDETTELSEISKERKPKTIVKKKTAPAKPIMKFIAPRPPPAAKKTSETPPEDRSPTPPPPPPTPLPEFITQFKGVDWFEQYFPNCNTNTMPKPWTVSAFVGMLVRVLRIAEYPMKVKVAEAILTINHNEGIPNKESVQKTVLAVLHHHKDPPTCQDPDQKEFILLGLELMVRMGVYDKEFHAEVMCQFLDGDQTVRLRVQEIWKSIGVRDPHNYFPKEMDCWDTWNIEEKNRKDEVKRICRAWLDKWMATFKIHLEDSMERLKRGEQVRGHVTKGDMQGGETTEPPLMDGVEFIPEAEAQRKRPRAVTFDITLDSSTLDNATYTEAVNYFCEMELEKNLEMVRTGGAKDKPDGPQKNTVLVLPKLTGKGTLVRLGETHTSKCRPNRESSLADFRLPPIMMRGRQPDPGQLYGFVPCINLPMKQVVMNPFHCALDDYVSANQEPVLLTLKTSQKYFVHSRSYIPPENAYA